MGTSAAMRERRSDAIIVRVNRIIADLVPGYLAARRNEILEIRRRIEDRDLDTLRVIGHQLKGSGEGYGFREITLLGAQIEDAARGGDLKTIREAADRLEEYIHCVTVVTED
jgi:HPt (histidine-containing phosphotransfer) domain-containing protein